MELVYPSRSQVFSSCKDPLKRLGADEQALLGGKAMMRIGALIADQAA
jgi:hypothetical protein